MGELRARDLEAVREQLGREPTTEFTVVARCSPGHPLAIRNHPLDAEGLPFPTRFWLTCPEAVKAVSRLEAAGWIGRLNERYEADAGFRDALEETHRAAAEERGRAIEGAERWGGVGGTRRGIKCLHAHYAHHLGGGPDPVGEWVAERVEPIHAEDEARERVAAIDMGTNSIRLLVAEPDGQGGLFELARDMVITRLGQGVDRTGRLAPEALARTRSVLSAYGRRASALHVTRVRVGATSTVRDAAERDELAAAVRELVGAEMEVISGQAEAALSFLGATRGLEEPTPFLVLDIGGGSTELVLGTEAPAASVSSQIGSVRLTERHVRHDPPRDEELAAIRAEVEASLDEAAARIPVGEARTLVAVAGTATTVQGTALDLDRYDPDRIHRTEITVETAEQVLATLGRMTVAERAAIPVMPKGREDVIVAGAVILSAVLRRFKFDRALVSESDILDGLALEALEMGIGTALEAP